ncbi:MAG TPA: PQQ-dependent sugar dehydrogenase [bacterium]|jgi:glucose/arabinose dehydrogenase|nr:PQQ-dependent sugar dehydrogenase [bacterium]
MRSLARLLVIGTACLLGLTGALPATAQAPAVQLQRIAHGLIHPLQLTHAGDGSGRLFIVEQRGVIRVMQDETILPTPFLDIRDRVTERSEMGLLSIAFHPLYTSNGLFYVNYTTELGGPRRSVIAEYRAWPPSGNVVDRTERIVLEIPQPYTNHNGGLNLFGPDGMLYIGLGDGGSGGDPQNNGQRLNTLLGKILRINVDSGTPYGIPPDNPFVGKQNVRPEIWAYGFRNPWRFSFDRKTQKLFVGDVGQNAWEEVDIVEPGRNYGWRIMEGRHCYNPPSGCSTSGLRLPTAEYGHDVGCSVTGGYVYRGTTMSELRGRYLFGDYCTGLIWILSGGGPWTMSLLVDTTAQVSSFGEDPAGELYVVDYGGRIYKIVPSP